MYTESRFSKTRVIELQQQATTVAEAVAHYRRSCNMCNAWKCAGMSCPVTLAHNAKLAALEAEELAKKNPPRIIYPRKYEKSASGIAARKCAYFYRAGEGTQQQLEFCKIAAALIRTRDFGGLEEAMKASGTARGRVPNTPWGEVITAVRAVIKAAKEI